MDEYIERKECRDNFYASVLSILSGDSTNDRANQIIDEFDTLPAADVEPVKRGVWELDYDRNFHRCSNCKESSIRYTDEWGYEIDEELTNFCPECGAKMRGIQK